MSFSFYNWKSFREYMKQEGVSVAKFEFGYYRCHFGIVYSLEQNVFWVAKRGTQIAFPIYLDWYKASVILDKEPYKELAACKDEAYDPNKRYSPFDFLKSLDEHLGTRPTLQRATHQELYSLIWYAIPDEDKVYFQRFIPHISDSRHVRDNNLEKTRKILGPALAEFCKKNNVSVAFSAKPTERSFDIIMNPEKTLKEFELNSKVKN